MLCLGVFHGFEHGSCSSTGYSRNYGPVPHCSKGTGWWMLMLMAGLVVAGGGAALARSVGTLMLPLVFVAIGAPFIALALGNHGQLLFNASSSSGKIFAGVFGGCFVITGLIWGLFAARNITGVSGGSLLGGLLAAVVGVGAAFAIAAGVSSAIGKTTAPSSVQLAPGVTVLSPAAERARQISLCEDLVAGERPISARDKALLTPECNTNWKAAEHQLPAAARRGALAHVAAQCKQQTQQAGAAGLPAAAGSTLARALAAACGNPATSSQGTGLKSLHAQLCQQIVKAQVPAAAQQQALAACPKS
jgi:drug/metabolite transporter superfamily protein YnfA